MKIERFYTLKIPEELLSRGICEYSGITENTSTSRTVKYSFPVNVSLPFPIVSLKARGNPKYDLLSDCGCMLRPTS